jgi:hypothetical protein
MRGRTIRMSATQAMKFNETRTSGIGYCYEGRHRPIDVT